MCSNRFEHCLQSILDYKPFAQSTGLNTPNSGGNWRSNHPPPSKVNLFDKPEDLPGTVSHLSIFRSATDSKYMIRFENLRVIITSLEQIGAKMPDNNILSVRHEVACVK